MTNPLELNDLSHLSDEQFRALCPLGEHAPGPELLSPAAQAVMDHFLANVEISLEHGLAAALRAAADQVAPEQLLEDVPGRFVNGCCHAQRQNTRAQLLAIATELEAHHG